MGPPFQVLHSLRFGHQGSQVALATFRIIRPLRLQDLSALSNAESSFDERLGLMVDRELTELEDARLTTRLKAARLRHNACLEDIDYRSPRGLDKTMILQLGSIRPAKSPTQPRKAQTWCALKFR
ncbi:ATP-binding protein, partial [Pseudomonas syringae]|uniref:ATP-binding protein n=1 Tax=Pseudomonas syringae TaxID=317 RepID=UPI000AEA57EF